MEVERRSNLPCILPSIPVHHFRTFGVLMYMTAKEKKNNEELNIEDRVSAHVL